VVAGLTNAAMNEHAWPRTMGRYRIDGVLGNGAMAVVYAGFDPDIDRQVAIKCLHREVASDPAYRERFLIEARAAGNLTHPNIVTIFDVGETLDGFAFIAMERLSGETLASRVASEGLPPLPVIIELATQLAAALDYAHAQGIVHHDIKPENIMLADGWHFAKISDFGIAQRGGGSTAVLDEGGEVGGTLAYMAMERLRGETQDARSDLFSLGVVLCWLVTGKLPWRETVDVRRLISERQRSPHPTIEPIDPATPSILVEVVHTLLAPAAQARYQRGAEVVEDLRQARREYEQLDEKPFASRIISLRLRWAAALGSTLCLVLLLGLAAIHATQKTAVTGLALDFGSSLGRMIARESAENLLLGDHAATRALVEDVARNRQIHYLAIADRRGDIIASTQTAEAGKPLLVSAGQTPLAQSDGIKSYLSLVGNLGGGDEMLLFDVPIGYQDKTVGELRLGVSNEPLRTAQKTTLWVIVAVLLVTLAVVVGAAYWLFRRPLALLDMLGDALLQVARGDYHHRIRLQRKDELGRLFGAFNLMNGALQARKHPAAVSPHLAAEVTEQPTQRISPAIDDCPAG
jgi:serine/threonine protein kinase/HAMP domain-containing protein